MKLDLSTAPKLTRRHPVFHVSKLEPYYSKAGPSTPDDVRDTDTPAAALTDDAFAFLDPIFEAERAVLGVYEAERIMEHRPRTVRSHAATAEYKVRWKGYTPAADSWEPAERVMEDAQELVDDYWDHRAHLDALAQQRKQAPKPPPKPLPAGVRRSGRR